MRFNKKELIVILTGYPTFSLSIFKWTTEQQMVALSNEPSEFSDLLIRSLINWEFIRLGNDCVYVKSKFDWFLLCMPSPLHDNHWVEYGRQHMTFYDLQSFTKNDVVRTQIYLPQVSEIRACTWEKSFYSLFSLLVSK